LPRTAEKTVEELERFIDGAHRRFSHGAGVVGVVQAPVASKEVAQRGPSSSGRLYSHVAASQPVAGPSQDTQGGTRKRRRRRNRRKARKERQARTSHQPPNHLVGDSMVGRAAGKLFQDLAAGNRVTSLPGAKIAGVKEQVEQLQVDRSSTLVLSVGGNDLFTRRGRPPTSEKLLQDYTSLLQVARRKVSRVLVVGLIPRRFATGEQYSRALAVNHRLANLCKCLSLRFVDPWKRFFGRNDFYFRDGIHFSEAGAKEFVTLIRGKLFRPLTAVPKARVEERPAGRRTTTTARTQVAKPQSEVLMPSEPGSKDGEGEGAQVAGDRSTPPDTAKRGRSLLTDGSPSLVEVPHSKKPKRKGSDSSNTSEDSSPSQGNESPSGAP
jgi:lysophospholipase L1-like esterase